MSLGGLGLLVSDCSDPAAHGALELAAPTSRWACGPWWHAVQQTVIQPSTRHAEHGLLYRSQSTAGTQGALGLLSRQAFWYTTVVVP